MPDFRIKVQIIGRNYLQSGAAKSDTQEKIEGKTAMKFCISLIAALSATVLAIACKQRNYNQASHRSETVVTHCRQEPSALTPSHQRGRANIRVSCQGFCEGDDYSSRRFYISNTTVAAGIEFEAKYKSGVRLRELFIFDSTLPVTELMKKVQLGTIETKQALSHYGLDETQISELSIPDDQLILLFPGTRASLSQAGLLDGGTLDCRGQPIEGSQLKEEFRQRNLNQIRRAATF